VELLGRIHTDYNDGLVMALAGQYIIIASSRRRTAISILVSSAFPVANFFSVNELKKIPPRPGRITSRACWNNSETRRAFYGFKAAIHGTIHGRRHEQQRRLEVAPR